jgi:hypothetical protein
VIVLAIDESISSQVPAVVAVAVESLRTGGEVAATVCDTWNRDLPCAFRPDSRFISRENDDKRGDDSDAR